MKLRIDHDMCYLFKKRPKNFSLNLITNDNCAELKMMCCTAVGKLLEDMIDVQRACTEMPRVIMSDNDK